MANNGVNRIHNTLTNSYEYCHDNRELRIFNLNQACDVHC